ncbi:hypothetical protein Ocin01_14254 [Orchesella cincta]|uniref:Extradiol ring-cleavage dioxygenase class III enzyme subunit B domain-containing protein n=1 Tax=Orchesella cincta TaxID=48709 RepID=A0A1D2MHF5_ORCCI|nr:hypothetical protein Ocin01_14254 [Orchesella cincta]
MIVFLVFTSTSNNGLPLLPKRTDLRNTFVGFYVFPHGGITLDPAGMDYSEEPAFSKDSQQKSIQLHDAMQQAADELIKSKPDLIIFSTPHGFHLMDNHVILSTSTVYGTGGWIWSNFTAEFDIDTELSAILYAELKAADNNVDLMSLGGGGETLPILWAEVIPWYFIREAAAKANFPVPSAVYIGQPSHVNIDGLRDLGRDISKVALLREEFTTKKIAVVISGDLSHYHSNDTNSPYPYSPISKVFDKHMVSWAKMDRNAETAEASSKEILENAGGIQGQAGHCGYTGLTMLHGMIEELVHQDWNFKSHFYTYQTPTYFGMMVASWLPV